MNSKHIRTKFLEFWKSQPRNSKEIPNVSLVPVNDPTLLFVNSGVFPIVKYLQGQKHPLGTRLHNVQRCVRTNDIEEVGDNRHMILFEMIGNWSLGDFTKRQQIPWIMEFYVDICSLDPKRMFVSVFAGDESAPRDTEAIEIWIETFKKYGIKAQFSEDISKIPQSFNETYNWPYRIFPYNKNKNWWCRAEVIGEIGGPTSEIFYDIGERERDQETYHINDDSGRFIEIGNNVFMEYVLNKENKWEPLPQKNIDFGGGLERLVMASQNTNDPFITDLFTNIVKKIESMSAIKYQNSIENTSLIKSIRIISEHARSSTFILGDGVEPSNKERGYILRRIIRRMIRHGHLIGINKNFSADLAEIVINEYGDYYKNLLENKEFILEAIDKEENKFRKTLNQGIKHFYTSIKNKNINLNNSYEVGKLAFGMYETYGFPIEMTIEELKNMNINVKEDDLKKAFDYSKSEHQNISKQGETKMFKSGLADTSIETTKLHTAHHILLAALQKLIDPKIKQRGSNITSERLRIDINLDRKLTEEEIKKVEDMVNSIIDQDMQVIKIEMPKEEAEKIGAQMEFGQKYPDIVTVYFICNREDIIEENKPPRSWFSAEFCSGPHVRSTKEISNGKGVFKIADQESIGSNTKRIKAKIF